MESEVVADVADVADAAVTVWSGCCSAFLTFGLCSATSHRERLPEAAEEELCEEVGTPPELDVGVA